MKIIGSDLKLEVGSIYDADDTAVMTDDNGEFITENAKMMVMREATCEEYIAVHNADCRILARQPHFHYEVSID